MTDFIAEFCFLVSNRSCSKVETFEEMHLLETKALDSLSLEDSVGGARKRSDFDKGWRQIGQQAFRCFIVLSMQAWQKI